MAKETLEKEKDASTEISKKNYTAAEVAQFLDVSLYTVHELLRTGKIKGFKLTSHWRIPEENLKEFMNIDHIRKEGN